MLAAILTIWMGWTIRPVWPAGALVVALVTAIITALSAPTVLEDARQLGMPHDNPFAFYLGSYLKMLLFGAIYFGIGYAAKLLWTKFRARKVVD